MAGKFSPLCIQRSIEVVLPFEHRAELRIEVRVIQRPAGAVIRQQEKPCTAKVLAVRVENSSIYFPYQLVLEISHGDQIHIDDQARIGLWLQLIAPQFVDNMVLKKLKKESS